jgi:tRNA(fMet)-specific endonuclease VapC
MIGNKYLLDTNIIIAWLQGETAIADKIEKSEEVYIPIIVVGELYYGAAFSSHVQKNIKEIKKLTSNYNVLLIDEEASFHYGNIKTALRKIGKPIPENDIWIAAIALRYELIVVTRDNHFKIIDSISLQNW